jgi:ribosomal subunit interface protein
MIERLEISGVHTEVTEDLRRYIAKKIGKLDSYMPRHARGSAHVEVKLKESHSKDKKKCTCEAVIHMPQDTFTVHESTMNMFAAVDIVEEKMKNHLKRYKEKHAPNHRRDKVRRMLGRIRTK